MHRQYNTHGLKKLSGPAEEPISVAELKSYLRINTSADDAMLLSFITSARDYIERTLGRILVNQTWQQTMDRFPADIFNDAGLQDGITEGALSEFLVPNRSIDILLAPLVSVQSIKTYDDSNTEYTMPTTDYYVDTDHDKGRVSLTNDSTWPTTFLRPTSGIKISFTAGYGANASFVPPLLKQAVIDLAGHFYETRGCDESKIPPSVLRNMNSFRIYRI